MSKRKFTKKPSATAGLDAIALAHYRQLERQRKRSARILLQRRRQKSGQ
jgi:hypothetical protein